MSGTFTARHLPPIHNHFPVTHIPNSPLTLLKTQILPLVKLFNSFIPFPLRFTPPFGAHPSPSCIFLWQVFHLPSFPRARTSLEYSGLTSRFLTLSMKLSPGTLLKYFISNIPSLPLSLTFSIYVTESYVGVTVLSSTQTVPAMNKPMIISKGTPQTYHQPFLPPSTCGLLLYPPRRSHKGLIPRYFNFHYFRHFFI